MRVLPLCLAALALTACTPSVPDSGAGVGFGDYNSYVRGAQPAPSAPMNAMAVEDPATAGPAASSLAGGFSPANAAAAIDRASGAAPAVNTAVSTPIPMASTLAPAQMTATTLDANGARPRGNAPTDIKVESGEMAGINPSISDENDFKAVSARESIQSDKDRIARNKAQYQVDQPTALPQRSGGTGVSSVIEFALSTSHPVGTQMYKRSGMRMKSPASACQKYGSDVAAQEDFLASGGPQRDRKGIDPDGDGYACGWNPAPFRAAQN